MKIKENIFKIWKIENQIINKIYDNFIGKKKLEEKNCCEIIKEQL